MHEYVVSELLSKCVQVLPNKSAHAAGSDLLGQTVAALSAIALVFDDTDPDYATLLEGHARELYM